MKATASIEQIRKLSLKKGDIIITKDSETADDIAVPAIIDEDIDNLVCGYHLAILKPNNHDIKGKFLLRVLQGKKINDQFTVNANGVTRFGISTYPIKNSYLIIPPIEEQEQISEYIDQETSRITATIEKYEKLIELLKEKRIALISHAVTKGLDPNVKMKDSGVEWIGEIPAHWVTKKLKYLSNIKTGDKNTEDSIEDGIYPFFVRSQTVERLNSYSFDGEAVLTAGDGVGVGKVFHYYNGKFDYHQRVYAITNFSGVIGGFIFYYLKTNLIKEMLKYNAKSTVDSLRLPMFQNFMVAFPQEEKEQESIVEYIDSETSKIDQLIEKISKQIVLLNEYKTSLISHAVTGKIDVRGEVS